VADQIGEQHNAAGEANLPQTDAAQEGRDAFSGQGRHTVHIGDGSGLFQR
jgi:hypothetical protein